MKLVCTFLVMLACVASGLSQTLRRAEYFFDADPGRGNATSLSFTAGATINQTFNISTATLSSGFHTLNTRVISSDGIWSLFTSRTFYIAPPVSTPVLSTQVRRAEFFIDSDPGVGNATPISFSVSDAVSFPITIPVNTLSSGFHVIGIRVIDNEGRWSVFTQRTFYIVPPVNGSMAATVVKAEYFIDQDPGVGNGVVLPITSANPQSNIFTIDVSSVNPGFHRMCIRYQDNLGRWSHFMNRTFYIVPIDATPATHITKLEYFIDVDPDINTDVNGTGVTLTPSASVDQTLPIDISGVLPGDHILYLRAKDNLGNWSTIQEATFSIMSCTPPAAPTAHNVSRCDEGEITLTATGASNGQVYRWYDDETSTTALSIGSVFQTPSLPATRSYYVSVYDEVTTCESARASVAAIINVMSKPVVNPAGDLSFCEGNIVTLSAPAGFSQYIWSTGESTRQIVVSTTGTYAVQVGDGNCISPASDPVNISVVALPQKPTVTVNGNTTICGSGSVMLAGPAGFEYVWSNGATTREITVSQTGVYFLRVRSDGCLSDVSDPVVVAVLAEPCNGNNPGNGPVNHTPVISAAPLSTPIEGIVSVDLASMITDEDANIDYGSLRLLTSTTARGASASIDVSYNLIVDYSGIPFTGTDRITIEVCDLAGACTQQVLDIEVVGEVVVYNGVTPDGDGKNDFLLIKYIDIVEGAQQNKVTIFNRWGDVVFDVSNYNNDNLAFRGTSNGGNDLPSGTYFYKVEFAGRIKPLTGFITLKR